MSLLQYELGRDFSQCINTQGASPHAAVRMLIDSAASPGVLKGLVTAVGSGSTSLSDKKLRRQNMLKGLDWMIFLLTCSAIYLFWCKLLNYSEIDPSDVHTRQHFACGV